MNWSRPAHGMALVVAGVAGSAGAARAFDARNLLAYQWGPVTIRTSLSVSEQFNDNIYYRSSARRTSDLITSITPGIDLSLGTPYSKHYLSLGYEFHQNFYQKRSDVNYSDHSLSFNLRLTGYRVSLQGSDQIELQNSVMGGGLNPLVLGESANVERITFSDSYQVSYSFTDKINGHIGLSHGRTDYESGTWLYDSTSLRGTLGATYKPRTRMTFVSEVYYGKTMSEPNHPLQWPAPDMNSLGTFVGVSEVFLNRITGTVRVGYEVRQFEGRSGSKGDPVVNASLSYRFSERLRGTLSYARSTSVSAQSPDSSYASDNVNLSLNRTLGPTGKIMVSGGGTLRISQYDGGSVVYGDRTDNQWTAFLDVSYRFQPWLSTGLRYEYELFNSSSKAIIDYDVNRITLRLGIGF